MNILLDQFQTARTKNISNMLDNPDEVGIYPTSKFYQELDELFIRLTEDLASKYEQLASLYNKTKTEL